MNNSACILIPCYSSEHQKWSWLLYLRDLMVHSQFHTMGKEDQKISRHNYHVKHIHAVCNSMRQKGETVWCMHCKKTRPGLFQLSLTQLQSESMHSKYYSVQLKSGLNWDIMVLLKEFNQLVTKFSLKKLQCAYSYNVPACHQIKSLQCACLLPKCSLKACNVSACYQSVP